MSRNHLFIRPAVPSDAQQFDEWSRANPANDFDPDVAAYPSTVTWCVYDKNGPLAYMPMQCPLMMESLAVRPCASKYEIALALKELTQLFVTQAHTRGSGEIYFIGSDDMTDALAQNQMFERVKAPVYRLKIRDLSHCESTRS